MHFNWQSTRQIEVIIREMFYFKKEKKGRNIFSVDMRILTKHKYLLNSFLIFLSPLVSIHTYILLPDNESVKIYDMSKHCFEKRYMYSVGTYI